jgi:predicted ATPase with chaperone activity
MHARLARRLIEACGGLEEAAQACRVSKSKLSDYQNPMVGLFMPADVMFDLEAYAGEPSYSRALFEARPEGPPTSDLMKEAAEATEAVARLQGAVRKALDDGDLSPNEADRLAALHSEAETELREVGLLLNHKN